MDYNNNLGQYIAEVIRSNRKGKELTQTDLAEMIGTKQPSIARLESGNILPSLGFLKKVSDSLGIEIDISLQDKSKINASVV